MIRKESKKFEKQITLQRLRKMKLTVPTNYKKLIVWVKRKGTLRYARINPQITQKLPLAIHGTGQSTDQNQHEFDVQSSLD